MSNSSRQGLERQIDGTLAHTRKVLDNVLSFVFEPTEFSRKHNVDISRIGVFEGDAEYLAVVALIHDLWKPISSIDHAEQGGRFLAEPKNVIAVRFHDRFGIVHTGEASLLFLDDLAAFLESVSKHDADEILNRLRIFTIVDVAAYGYLDQARVDTYDYLVGLLQDIPDAREFERIARSDTKKRVKRLIEANNRVYIDEAMLSAAFDAFKYSDALEDRLLHSRFDYGAYSLEPLFRNLILGWNSYLIDDNAVATVEEGSPSVASFLQCLLDVLAGDAGMGDVVSVTEINVGRRQLFTYNMSALSIKAGDNLDAFRRWAERY